VKYSGRVPTDFKWLKKGLSDGLLWTQPSFQVSWQTGNGFTSWGIKSFSRSIRSVEMMRLHTYRPTSCITYNTDIRS
jgi:hypothetical protein